ncbi:GH3 auxin-responsive promoter family protein [Cesiribacter sp. SM1]|uniref:GH3 auxin-responsive promoter family protein n=1 Tax=Cesiribacter sp. SM1 TaxID=2861196 RepID=UPI001CD5AFC0|nr:GH3 auxin-responsive promoter family protein [Cesiribacter sp. SM1]
MGIRSVLSKPLAAWVAKEQRQWSLQPAESQRNVFRQLIESARNTAFGKDHGFGDIKTYRDFQERVPVADYEDLKKYIERVKGGEKDVLWPGQPLYFAKTSGTTSGTKYIPISKESIPYHINGARNALLNYVHSTGSSKFLDGKLMFLSGSPEMKKENGIYIGRLSGIVNHHVPGYLRTNQMPSWETNIIDDWETKVDTIVAETLDKDMTLISGIPPWVQMYFDKIVERTGKKIKDVFPNFSLFVYGGVNFEPYRAKLFETIGKHINSIETYPASEGFIAYQDLQADLSQGNPGLLLLLNHGIWYEFIPADQYFEKNPPRLTIEDVELGVNYAVVMNTNAGLWGYSIGDTVQFVSKDPYRIIVSGRIKHFISAFGEHVIGSEVEGAMRAAVSKYPEVELIEFTVAPQVTPAEGLPLHEWFVEFATPPKDLAAFEKELNLQLQHRNTYYDDLITGSVLRPLEIRPLQRGAFQQYMKSQGKLGGQNKVPRLSNDRKLADGLQAYVVK